MSTIPFTELKKIPSITSEELVFDFKAIEVLGDDAEEKELIAAVVHESGMTLGTLLECFVVQREPLLLVDMSAKPGVSECYCKQAFIGCSCHFSHLETIHQYLLQLNSDLPVSAAFVDVITALQLLDRRVEYGQEPMDTMAHLH